MVERTEPVMTDRQARTSQRGCQARTKRYRWREGASNGNFSRSKGHPVDSRHLPPCVLLKRNLETPYLRPRMASARKGAHVRQVLRREIACRTDLTREGEGRP